MHGRFMEGGDSVLNVFSWELLQAKLQHKYCGFTSSYNVEQKADVNY